jgi:Mycoplasma protein of unknown function, DUF285
MNANLMNWNVTSVHDMSSMFINCFSFEGRGLDSWQTDSLEKMDMIVRPMTHSCPTLCVCVSLLSYDSRFLITVVFFPSSPTHRVSMVILATGRWDE